MEAASTPPTDIDLTGPGAESPPPPPPPAAEGGPNAPHANDDDAAREEETTYPAAAPEPEPKPAAGGPSEPAPETPPAPSVEPEPTSEPTPPPAPSSEAGPGGGTDPAGGAEADRKKSGSAKRDYTLLEEQQVVPLTALSDAERKKHEGKAVTGYVERAGGPVEGRNADVVLEAVYPDEESVPEGVSGVLPVSERNWHPVELNFEPVQRSRLKLKRR